MTTWSALHTDEATLLAVIFKKEPGSYNVTVPASAKYVRAAATGCGGQGDHWGGGGAYARSRVTVNVGDNLVIQVGATSTAGTPGDSFVKRNDGTVICYADRGRGVSTGGLASNSTGDVKRDGTAGVPGTGGPPATDASDTNPLGFGGVGANNGFTHAADYGGGGLIATDVDENGVGLIKGAVGAGTGLVCLQFFDSDPGY